MTSIGAEAWCARAGVAIAVSSGVAHARPGITLGQLVAQADAELTKLKARRGGAPTDFVKRGDPVQL